jgi:hypothetical protein
VLASFLEHDKPPSRVRRSIGYRERQGAPISGPSSLPIDERSPLLCRVFGRHRRDSGDRTVTRSLLDAREIAMAPLPQPHRPLLEWRGWVVEPWHLVIIAASSRTTQQERPPGTSSWSTITVPVTLCPLPDHHRFADSSVIVRRSVRGPGHPRKYLPDDVHHDPIIAMPEALKAHLKPTKRSRRQGRQLQQGIKDRQVCTAELDCIVRCLSKDS